MRKVVQTCTEHIGLFAFADIQSITKAQCGRGHKRSFHAPPPPVLSRETVTLIHKEHFKFSFMFPRRDFPIFLVSPVLAFQEVFSPASSEFFLL